MKFKVIFILFNVVIVASFLIIYLMPLAMLGMDYTREFWTDNWGLPIVFAAILAVLNSYFIINWRLFHLLEREDWEGLKTYVEDRVYQKRRYTSQQVRVLVNAYLITSDLQKVRDLHAFFSENDVKSTQRHALLLGIPFLLSEDASETVSYFGSFEKSNRLSEGGWISWNHAFGLVQMGNLSEAKECLLDLHSALKTVSKDPILFAVTINLLSKCDDTDTHVSEVIAQGKADIRKKYTPSSWDRRVERAKASVHVVILARLIDDVTVWIFESAA